MSLMVLLVSDINYLLGALFIRNFIHIYIYMRMSRCILFLMLRSRIRIGIRRGGDTASFMALASFLDA